MKKEILFVQILFLSINYVKSEESEKLSELTQHEKERLHYGERMASYMDRNVDPCKDFYKYACGNFFNIHKEERALGRFGSVFMMITNLDNTLYEMLMEPVNRTNSEKVSAADKAKYFYQSCMNEKIFDYKKSEAYLKLIDSFGGWPLFKSDWKPSDFDWFNMTCILKSYGINTIFQEFANPMDGSSVINVAEFGLLEMNDELNKPYSRVHQTNKEIAKQILSMYGLSKVKAAKAFKDILIFGKNLYSLRQKAKLRKSYNVDEITLDELQKLTPQLNWTMFYSTLYPNDIMNNITINIIEKKFLKKLPHLFYGKNIKRAANYFILKMLYELHDELKAWKDMKKYCLEKVKEVMNPVLSAMFLDSKYHDKYIEDEVLAIASYVRSAFKDSIKTVDWLDMETRRGALRKLNSMDIIIGDSQLSLDMEKFDEELADVEVSLENGFHQNHLNLRKFATINHPSRKPLNIIYSIDVNAFYVPFENKLIVPAGIFRKPFYYPELPKAYNFGVIGSIIGHEFTHSLDIDGKDYDETGEVTHWFSEEADKEYKERAGCLVEQYDKYRLEGTMSNVRGSRTLGENISDNGGLRHSFYGYKKWLEANLGSLDMSKQTLPVLNMTDEQLFFLSFAQTWCEKVKGFKEVEKSSFDVHTPGKFRALGSLSNFDEFSKAFQCKKGSTMNPEKKCVIW